MTLEVATHLLDEDVREHGIHAGLGGVGCRRRRRRRNAQRLARDARGVGIALGERLRLLHQQLHVDLRRPADLELLEQLRQRRRSLP